jgi:hypothetical protein
MMDGGWTMQDQDFDYFIQNTEQFYKEYGPKYLAIKNQGIIGIYDTFTEALNETLKKEPLGTFLIQKCLKNRNDGIYRFQSNVRAIPRKRQMVK